MSNDQKFIVDEWVPEGAVTRIYGAGDVFRTHLMTDLAIRRCLGEPFCGHSVVQGSVLFVDAEMDVREFTRRAYALARGLGHDRPPEGLYYHELQGALGDPQVQADLLEARAQTNTDFVVLDSLTIA